MDATWYLKRLASMDRSEVIGRVEDKARQRLWRHRPPPAPSAVSPTRLPIVPQNLIAGVDETARDALVTAADELLVGRSTIFGRERTDATAELDYFADPLTGRRAPDTTFSFDINHRHEDAVGNIKFVWEPARHQHLSMLAAAYAVTEDDRYAARIDAELRHYWATNPFLTGIHWTSGIELGIRLISWTWIRRLLDGWTGAPALFEDNPTFHRQLGRHHQWLATFGAHGSSANNHLIAEAAGQFVAAAGFGLFADSDRWRDAAAEELAAELPAQTFSDGLNRELASDYHGLVLELALAAWVEAVIVGHPLADGLAEPITRMCDALQAVVDERGQLHRQGDSDDAHGWLLDPVEFDKWGSLLASCRSVLTPARWWRSGSTGDVRSAVIAACVAGRQPMAADPDRRRPSRFSGAGLTVLRDHPGTAVGEELWCRFDHGPHGFLSTAAHAHADALSVEIRCGGVEVVADPGTYCYHGEQEWRDHFRSTLAHATVTLDGADQSDIGGPFLWTRKAETVAEAATGLTEGPVATAAAGHDGYEPRGLRHRRSVRLDRGARTIEVTDTLVEAGGGTAQSAVMIEKTFPLGPTVQVTLDEEAGIARLTWPGQPNRATVTLDPNLSWRVVCGREAPPLGWYSARFGTREPSSVLIGSTPAVTPGEAYTTLFSFQSDADRNDETEEVR
ncbi:MAG: alginate lyase family protein [Actinomycetota bacterium]